MNNKEICIRFGSFLLRTTLFVSTLRGKKKTKISRNRII